jgi:hypothetical protein
MTGIKYSNITFLLFNVFSRMLIPFSFILYSALRQIIAPLTLQNPLDTWLISFFSIIFFIFLQNTVIKDCRVRYRRKNLWLLGMMWISLAIIVHGFSFCFTSNVSWDVFYGQYNILKSPWPYMLLSILFAPRICSMTLRRSF